MNRRAEEVADTILCKKCKHGQSKEYVCGMRRSKQYCVQTLNFILGYKQAEKDTIERAISWLKEHANKYIVDVGVGYGENSRNVELIVGGMCWEHLKKALED